MGRYYTGDIEGKFWFGVQSSDDANHFGGSEIEIQDDETQEVYELEYHFTKEDLGVINSGLENCKEEIGKERLQKVEAYFGPGGNGENGYNPTEMAKEFGFTDSKDSEYIYMMELYARIGLGEKIKKCVEDNGECHFSAEL